MDNYTTKKTRIKRPVEDRFWEKVDVRGPNDCWLWRGSIKRLYGQFWYINSTQYAHRVSYELAYGDIPTGAWVLHTCDTPACVNPSHLFLGSAAINSADRNKKGRQAKGELSQQSSLTSSSVISIRGLYKSGITIKTLARRYGVLPLAIWRIVRRITWKHLE